jgi:glutamine amidotransferase
MLAIVDYGMGNLRSLSNALEELGAPATISGEPKVIAAAEKIFLPGVGAIAQAMQRLNEGGLSAVLRNKVGAGTPLLGICLGMQILCARSFEDGEHAGLGWIDAECVRFDTARGLKVPHIGWNEIQPRGDHPLLRGVDPGSDVYFVHSYYVSCNDPEEILATSTYGDTFTSVCARDNVMGVQFHPEKSQLVGLRILRNFLSL